MTTFKKVLKLWPQVNAGKERGGVALYQQKSSGTVFSCGWVLTE
jgi:hypothetical protein